jgi:hypothetical protein
MTIPYLWSPVERAHGGHLCSYSDRGSGLRKRRGEFYGVLGEMLKR